MRGRAASSALDERRSRSSDRLSVARLSTRMDALRALQRGLRRGSVVRRVREKLGDESARKVSSVWKGTEELFDGEALIGRFGPQRALLEAARIAQQGPSLSDVVDWCALKGEAGNDGERPSVAIATAAALGDDLSALRDLTAALLSESGRDTLIEFAEREWTLADASASVGSMVDMLASWTVDDSIAAQLVSDERFADIRAAATVRAGSKSKAASQLIVVSSRGVWVLKGESPYDTVRVVPWPMVAGVAVPMEDGGDASRSFPFTLRVRYGVAHDSHEWSASSGHGLGKEERIDYAAATEAERSAIVGATRRGGVHQFAASRQFALSDGPDEDGVDEVGHWTYVNVSTTALGLAFQPGEDTSGGDDARVGPGQRFAVVTRQAKVEDGRRVVWLNIGGAWARDRDQHTGELQAALAAELASHTAAMSLPLVDSLVIIVAAQLASSSGATHRWAVKCLWMLQQLHVENGGGILHLRAVPLIGGGFVEIVRTAFSTRSAALTSSWRWPTLLEIAVNDIVAPGDERRVEAFGRSVEHIAVFGLACELLPQTLADASTSVEDAGTASDTLLAAYQEALKDFAYLTMKGTKSKDNAIALAQHATWARWFAPVWLALSRTKVTRDADPLQKEVFKLALSANATLVYCSSFECIPATSVCATMDSVMQAIGALAGWNRFAAKIGGAVLGSVLSKVGERSRTWKNDMDSKEWTKVLELIDALEDFMLWRPIDHWAPHPKFDDTECDGSEMMLPTPSEGENRAHELHTALHITLDKEERCKWDDRSIAKHAIKTLEQIGVTKMDAGVGSKLERSNSSECMLQYEYLTNLVAGLSAINGAKTSTVEQCKNDFQALQALVLARGKRRKANKVRNSIAVENNTDWAAHLTKQQPLKEWVAHIEAQQKLHDEALLRQVRKARASGTQLWAIKDDRAETTPSKTRGGRGAMLPTAALGVAMSGITSPPSPTSPGSSRAGSPFGGLPSPGSPRIHGSRSSPAGTLFPIGEKVAADPAVDAVKAAEVAICKAAVVTAVATAAWAAAAAHGFAASATAATGKANAHLTVTARRVALERTDQLADLNAVDASIAGDSAVVAARAAAESAMTTATMSGYICVAAGALAREARKCVGRQAIAAAERYVQAMDTAPHMRNHVCIDRAVACSKGAAAAAAASAVASYGAVLVAYRILANDPRAAVDATKPFPIAMVDGNDMPVLVPTEASPLATLAATSLPTLSLAPPAPAPDPREPLLVCPPHHNYKYRRRDLPPHMREDALPVQQHQALYSREHESYARMETLRRIAEIRDMLARAEQIEERAKDAALGSLRALVHAGREQVAAYSASVAWRKE